MVVYFNLGPAGKDGSQRSVSVQATSGCTLNTACSLSPVLCLESRVLSH